MDVFIEEAHLYRMIGVRLKQLREQKNLSQAELAESIGMLRTSVTNIEAGRQRPPLHVLYQICAVLEVEPAHLLPSLEEATLTTSLTIESMTTLNEGARSLPPQAANVLQGLVAEMNDPKEVMPVSAANNRKKNGRHHGQDSTR